MTVIVPFGLGELFHDRVPAGAAVLNGAGEAIGITTIGEWGVLETPIFLTSSMAIGRVYDAAISTLVDLDPTIGDDDALMPVVAECDDGWLNASRRVQVEAADVDAALADAAGPERGPVRGGAVGAGTGMVAFELKGGIGSASRLVHPSGRRHRRDEAAQADGPDDPGYTVGVLALANFGWMRRLTIDGVRVGEALESEGWTDGVPRDHERGSCVVVVATDAPLSGAALTRLARRAGMGLARTGSTAGHGSGEIFLAFSTDADPARLDHGDAPLRDHRRRIPRPVLRRRRRRDRGRRHRCAVPGRHGHGSRWPRRACAADRPDAGAAAGRRPPGPGDVAMTHDLGPLNELLTRAAALAADLGTRARASTSVGQERSTLRLFGVTGVDAAGQPLAWAAVAQWLTRDRRGLGGGIALPFAMGLVEYDLDPQQLAQDVASGAVDLGLEADLLREPDRRLIAETEANRLARQAIERIDADRTARREIIGLLGDASRPWIGTTLTEPDLDGALDEVATLVAAGIDVIRVEIPVGRELAERLERAGEEVPEWRPGDSRATHPGAAPREPAPAGSQRALAELRRLADRLAAERRGYVRLATAAPALWSPEDAVVAAFERIDIVEADPMAEIVASGVDADRVLADHGFANRLHQRAGTIVAIGAGSPVFAPDLRSGIPSDASTRAGRALGLQALAIALAQADGLPDGQVAVAALPSWIGDEPSAAARSLGEVAVRRALYPGHPLAFSEPEGSPERMAAWPHILAAALVHAGDASFVLRRPGRQPALARDTRAAAVVAAEVAASRASVDLSGVALDHGRRIVEVALATLDLLAEHGWSAIIGDAAGVTPSTRSTGADNMADRTESFDPFTVLGTARG